MVTLTLPGDWLAVAPDGRAYEILVEAFKTAWSRAWGEPVAGLWKQGVPAPRRAAYGDFHDRPGWPDAGGPAFPRVVLGWGASVVAHPDPEQRRRHQLAGTGVDYATGLRSRDPRRIAVYFSKHGLFAAKSYQNEVPAEWQAPGKGPGRFWGYWGLQRLTASVELAPAPGRRRGEDAAPVGSRPKVTRQTIVRRADIATGMVRFRKVRRRVAPWLRAWLGEPERRPGVRPGPGPVPGEGRSVAALLGPLSASRSRTLPCPTARRVPGPAGAPARRCP